MPTNPHRTCNEDEVFISYYDKEFGERCRKAKKADLKLEEEKYVIKCNRCVKDAAHVDELYPYFSEDNLCREHMDEFYS